MTRYCRVGEIVIALNSTKTIIISPSGNFYGSEQVLYDFLQETRNKYHVFVPTKGVLCQKLKTQGKHELRTFSDTRSLYLKIFFLLLTKRATAVYCNEGGHIRYIKLLAGLFTGARFILHIRILEDTEPKRIGSLRSNILLVSISQYVSGFLSSVNCDQLRTIYDPYITKYKNQSFDKVGESPLRVAVIGRVTRTKGLEYANTFCDFLEANAITNIEMNFYGDVEMDSPEVATFAEKAKRYKYVKVKFEGFIGEKDRMYSSSDLVVHFSRMEPLGRIFFESLDHGVPFLGFNEAGIGEIARILSLEDCMLNFATSWENQLLNKIYEVNHKLDRYEAARARLSQEFSPAKYCKSLEEVITPQ